MKKATDIKTKRKYIENFIYNLFNALDKTGENTNQYKNMFSSMSEKDFEKFVQRIIKRDTYLYLDIEEFERQPSIDDITEAADIMKVPLYETVTVWDKEVGEYVSTVVPVPVGYLHIRRVQQLVVKKNNTSTNVSIRNPKTGQVTGADKVVRDSDMENYVLSVLDTDNIMKELLGPRADDMVAKEEMYKSISRNGFVGLGDLPDAIENKVALNTLDTYFTSAGIKTDLVTDGLLLPRTIRNRKQNVGQINSKYKGE